MLLNVSLSPDLEDRLREEAQRRGVSLDAVTVELLEEHLSCGGPVAASKIRRHDAFLKGYAPDDEGLYDDLGG